MRCYCCNNILSTQETTRKFSESNTYTDMCNRCLNTIDEEEIALEDGAYEEDDEYDE